MNAPIEIQAQFTWTFAPKMPAEDIWNTATDFAKHSALRKNILVVSTPNVLEFRCSNRNDLLDFSKALIPALEMLGVMFVEQ